MLRNYQANPLCSRETPVEEQSPVPSLPLLLLPCGCTTAFTSHIQMAEAAFPMCCSGRGSLDMSSPARAGLGLPQEQRPAVGLTALCAQSGSASSRCPTGCRNTTLKGDQVTEVPLGVSFFARKAQRHITCREQGLYTSRRNTK